MCDRHTFGAAGGWIKPPTSWLTDGEPSSLRTSKGMLRKLENQVVTCPPPYLVESRDLWQEGMTTLNVPPFNIYWREEI